MNKKNNFQSLLKKVAAIVDLSFDIPDNEKQMGHQIIQQVNIIDELLEKQDNFLDLIYNPFKSGTQTDPKQIEKDLQANKGQIVLYKKKLEENNTTIQYQSALAINYLSNFESDTSILEIINSFKSDIETLHEDTENLLEAISNFGAPDYINTITKLIDKIKTHIGNIKEFISERIIKTIDNNILAKNWTKLNPEDQNLQEKIPTVMRLVNDRQGI